MTLRSLTAALALACALAACGSSGANGGDGGSDAGAVDGTGGQDAPGETADDASSDAPADSADSATADASDAGSDALDAAEAGDVYIPPPVGSQLKQGDNLSVRGVTADGYLLYSDDVLLEAYVMPFAGGTVQDLGTLGSKFWNDQHGNDVFLWTGVTGSGNGVGALKVWSSATGLHTIAATSYGIASSASSSGGQILYIDNVDVAVTTGDVYVSTADGTTKTKLVSAISLSACYPSLGFAGSYAIVSYCPAGASGPFPATVAAFASPSWAAGASVASTSGNWWADGAGTKVLYTTAGGVSVVPLAGGGPVLIDATGTDGFLSSDGLSALYVTASKAFKSSPVASPSPTTLVASAFSAWQGLSGDGLQLLYYSTYTGNGTDLSVTSTTTAGASATITAATTASIPGDPFTSDSTHALYANGNTLYAYSVAGKTSVALGTTPSEVFAATAAKVVFDADYVKTGGLRFGRANIYSVDTAQVAAPTRLVTDADVVFALSPARDKIAYAWSAVPGSNAGIWVTNVP